VEESLHAGVEDLDDELEPLLNPVHREVGQRHHETDGVAKLRAVIFQLVQAFHRDVVAEGPLKMGKTSRYLRVRKKGTDSCPDPNLVVHADELRAVVL